MDQILKRPTEPVDAPRHHEVKLTKRGVAVELVESRPLLASLPTTDTVVTVDLDDHVTQAIGRGPKLTFLILGRLVGGTDPQIQRRAHGLLPSTAPKNGPDLTQKQLVYGRKMRWFHTIDIVDVATQHEDEPFGTLAMLRWRMASLQF